jgi:hypothetical protein
VDNTYIIAFVFCLHTIIYIRMRTHARLDNAKIQRDEGRLHLICALQHLLTVQKMLSCSVNIGRVRDRKLFCFFLNRSFETRFFWLVSHPINTICINKSFEYFFASYYLHLFFFFNFANIEQWLFLLYPNWFDHGSAPRHLLQ